MLLRVRTCLYTCHTITFFAWCVPACWLTWSWAKHALLNGSGRADAPRDGRIESVNKGAGCCGFSVLRLALDHYENKQGKQLKIVAVEEKHLTSTTIRNQIQIQSVIARPASVITRYTSEGNLWRVHCVFNQSQSFPRALNAFMNCCHLSGSSYEAMSDRVPNEITSAPHVTKSTSGLIQIIHLRLFQMRN